MITNAFPRFQSTGTFDENDAAIDAVVRDVQTHEQTPDWIESQAATEAVRETTSRLSEVEN